MAGRRIGCCSWSLQATTPRELADRVAATGLRAVQLALRPLRRGALDVDQTVGLLAERGIEICSGMMESLGEDYSSLESIRRTGGVRIDANWQANLEVARRDAQLARRLGMPLVTFHAGFLPHDRNDPVRGKMLDRLRRIVDLFADQGVAIAFETGQETAGTLLEALHDLDRPQAGVNFDPANMILYDMGDPIAALEQLAPHVRQIHIKDALRSGVPGQWGQEVQVGTGEVAWDAFFAVLRRQGLDVDLMIEREAGDQRIADIVAARQRVERALREDTPTISAPALTSSAAIGVGVIGLGFMGRTHIAAYARAAAAGFANRLVAVCDADEARRRGELAETAGNLGSAGAERLFDPAVVRGYADPDELLRDPDIGLVSICTPTDSHVDLAIAALRAGKHVLVEKPIALRSADVARLAVAARAATARCMPAMCMRFWPAWRWLKERTVDRSLGTVRSAVFRRLGTRPAWGGGFYADARRSGGAVIDLHIHDADFVRFCFGTPERLTATGDADHITALYRFALGPAHVVAEGGWDHSPGFPFRMQYTVVFDQATADFDLARDPQLLLCREGRAEPVTLEGIDGYDGEIRHLLQAIADPLLPLDATLDDAVELAHMLEGEIAQLGSDS